MQTTHLHLLLGQKRTVATRPLPPSATTACSGAPFLYFKTNVDPITQCLTSLPLRYKYAPRYTSLDSDTSARSSTSVTMKDYVLHA